MLSEAEHEQSHRQEGSLLLTRRVEEAQEILKALGLPTAQQNEISAFTLLALVSIGPNDPWTKALMSGHIC